MSGIYTSSRLIASVKRRAAIPENQSTFLDEDFLEFANEEMVNELVPEIMRIKEDYLLYSIDLPVVTGQTKYRIPARAMGNKLREVAFYDQTDNITELTRIGVEDLPFYNQTATLRAFYVKNGEIVLTGNGNNLSSGSYLKMTFYIRPNQLVDERRVRQITSITDSVDTLGRPIKILGFSTTPENFTGSIRYDIVQNQSPFVHLSIDLSPLSTPVNNTLTFLAEGFSDEVKVGDWLSVAEEAAVPQVPQELHSILAHKVAMRCLEAQGDMQGLQMAQAKSAKMDDRMTNLLDNRVEAAPRKIVNRYSSLRAGLWRRSGFRRR